MFKPDFDNYIKSAIEKAMKKETFTIINGSFLHKHLFLNETL